MLCQNEHFENYLVVFAFFTISSVAFSLDIETPTVVFVPANSIHVGSKVAIYCHIGAYPKPSFRWFKNGKEIPYLDSPMILLNPSKFSDAGTYQCNATNVVGSRISKVERLDIWGMFFC